MADGFAFRFQFSASAICFSHTEFTESTEKRTMTLAFAIRKECAAKQGRTEDYSFRRERTKVGTKIVKRWETSSVKDKIIKIYEKRGKNLSLP